MSDFFTKYGKKKEYLICVDSGGCVMDSMEVVHSRCFGPYLVDEWKLEVWRDEVLKRWREINISSLTRGINRFQALCILLEEMNREYCRIEDLDSLLQWTKTDPELSNRSLARAACESGSVCLRQALRWSEASNRAINRLGAEEKPPFEGVCQALARAHRYADVAVLSSADLRAVLDEWDLCGLLEHTDLVLARDLGSKKECVRALLDKGYNPRRALLIGDTMEDMEAARANGVPFFPILAGHERESWGEFSRSGLRSMLSGAYTERCQLEKHRQFRANLMETTARSAAITAET